MGLVVSMALLGPCILWMAILNIVTIVVGLIIAKLWMYKAPEDDEVWQDDKENFTML